MSRPGILWGNYKSRFETCATSGWMPAYHGTWFYGLWSILHHGIILESSNEGKGLGLGYISRRHTLTHPSIRLGGHEFWEPGVYVTRRFDTAQQYARPHQLFEDGNFYRCVLKAVFCNDKKITEHYIEFSTMPQCRAHDFIRDILLLQSCIRLKSRSCCGYRLFATNIPKKS